MKAKAKATIAVGLTMAALAGLVLPVGAGAAKTYHQKPEVVAELHLRGTHGFRFSALTFDDMKIVSASKNAGELGDESVNYFARGHGPAFHDGAFQMSVGKLGTFRGRFVAKSTKTHGPDGSCAGEPTITESGFFVGSFDFHGERGYSTVHAHSARGTVTRLGALNCTVPKGPSGPEKQEIFTEGKEGKREASLLAGDQSLHALFQASRDESARLRGETATTFQASTSGDKAGEFEISRSAFVFDFPSLAASTFRTPNLTEPTAEATLEPPKPFSGSATFKLEGPKTASWTGDLAVELPGLGRLQLTGGAIQAGLCAPRHHCTKTLPDHLQQLLEAAAGVTIAFGTAKRDS